MPPRNARVGGDGIVVRRGIHLDSQADGITGVGFDVHPTDQDEWRCPAIALEIRLEAPAAAHTAQVDVDDDGGGMACGDGLHQVSETIARCDAGPPPGRVKSLVDVNEGQRHVAAVARYDPERAAAARKYRVQRHRHLRPQEFKDTPQVGRTHGIHAEPTSFGLSFALWFDEMRRNRERLLRAREAVAVGKISGAVGAFAHLDPAVEEKVCAKLGLRAAPVSTQIIQRDSYAEYLCTLAVIASSIEKFALQIRHWQRTEVGEAQEKFKRGQKGSSAMPHKRNPILSERLCGMARLVRANSIVGLENVSLWHERDISHSSAERVVLPDSSIAADYMLQKAASLIDGLIVYPDRMLENLNATRGLIFSGQLLLVLTQTGVAREEAYEWVQRNAMKTWDEDADFKSLISTDKDITTQLTQERIDAVFSLENYLRNVDKVFARVFSEGLTEPRAVASGSDAQS